MILGFKKLIARFWLLFFFLLLFLFIGFFHISFKQIIQSVVSLRAWQLSVLIAVYFMISLCIIICRKYLVFSLNHSCTFKNLVLIHFASSAAHYSTPAKIGYPLTIYLLKKYEDIPYSTGTALIFIELTMSMGVSGLSALLGSLFYFHEYVGSIFKVLLILCVVGTFALWLIKVLAFNQKISNRYRTSIRDMIKAFSNIPLKRLLFYCVLTAGTQTIIAASLVVLCGFLSIEINIWQAVTASTAAFFLGGISMIPMGLGVREASMILFLSQFGIDNVSSILIVTIQRLLSTGLSFVLGSIFGVYLGIKNIQHH
jgi:uncharacterized protein (TIRG00374 family)